MPSKSPSNEEVISQTKETFTRKAIFLWRILDDDDDDDDDNNNNDNNNF